MWRISSVAFCFWSNLFQQDTPPFSTTHTPEITITRLRAQYPESIYVIIASATFGGHEEYVEQLLTKHCPDDSITYMRNEAAGFAARGGHENYAEHLRIELGSDANADSIAMWAAWGGNEEYADRLRIQLGANINMIARGAVRGKLPGYAERLCENPGADIERIAYELAKYGHIEHAERLRIKYNVNANIIVEGAAEAGNTEYCLKLIVDCGADFTFLWKIKLHDERFSLKNLNFLLTTLNYQLKMPKILPAVNKLLYAKTYSSYALTKTRAMRMFDMISRWGYSEEEAYLATYGKSMRGFHDLLLKGAIIPELGFDITLIILSKVAPPVTITPTTINAFKLKQLKRLYCLNKRATRAEIIHLSRDGFKSLVEQRDNDLLEAYQKLSKLKRTFTRKPQYSLAFHALAGEVRANKEGSIRLEVKNLSIQ